MVPMRLLGFRAAVLIALSLLVVAHPSSAESRLWVTPAVGGGWAESGGGGLAGSFSISWQMSHLVLSARAGGASGDFWGGGSGDVGALVGIGTWRDTHHLSASVGAGVAGNGLDAWSIPLQVQLYTLLSDTIGFGLMGFGAVTEAASYAGGGVALAIGNVR